MTEKPMGLTALLRTQAGAAIAGMILSSVVWLLLSGVLKPADFHSSRAGAPDETTRLLIKDVAREAADTAVEKYDSRWKEWREATDRRLERLEIRDRYLARTTSEGPRQP